MVAFTGSPADPSAYLWTPNTLNGLPRPADWRMVAVVSRGGPSPRALVDRQPESGPAGAAPGAPGGALVVGPQASLFGQTAFDAGEAKCTLGTGSFLLLKPGTGLVRSRHGLITTVAHKIDGQDAVYALEGAVAVAGHTDIAVAVRQVETLCDGNLRRLERQQRPGKILNVTWYGADNGDHEGAMACI